MDGFVPHPFYAISDEEVIQLIESTTQQPPHVGQGVSRVSSTFKRLSSCFLKTRPQIFDVEGDAPVVDISSQLVFSVPPQDLVSQAEAHIPLDSEQHACRNCKRKFKRNQELRRHLLSNLPHPFRCPHLHCSWTCSRQERLEEHIKKRHENDGPGQQRETQLYDPEILLDWMVEGDVDALSAANLATSLIEARLAEMNMASLETKVWSNRRRFCIERKQRKKLIH